MTLDEKLEQFYNAAIESATNQNLKIVDEYKQSLQKIYDEHKEDVLRKAKINYEVESNKLIREKNRKLSLEIINIKRKVNEKSAELIDKLFKEVSAKVMDFMKTPDYFDLLHRQITAAKEFAGGKDVTIYLNPSDEGLKHSLEAKLGVTLTISEINFIGGTRAVIHEQNILIDNSFLTKLSEAKSSFTF